MSDLFVAQSLFRFWLSGPRKVDYGNVFTTCNSSADIHWINDRYVWSIRLWTGSKYLSHPFDTYDAATESLCDVKAAANVALFIEGKATAMSLRCVLRSDTFSYPEIATVGEKHVWRICRTTGNVTYQSSPFDTIGQAMESFEVVREGCMSHRK
jgi:hypothetical protein